MSIFESVNYRFQFNSIYPQELATYQCASTFFRLFVLPLQVVSVLDALLNLFLLFLIQLPMITQTSRNGMKNPIKDMLMLEGEVKLRTGQFFCLPVCLNFCLSFFLSCYLWSHMQDLDNTCIRWDLSEHLRHDLYFSVTWIHNLIDYTLNIFTPSFSTRLRRPFNQNFSFRTICLHFVCFIPRSPAGSKFSSCRSRVLTSSYRSASS